MVIEFFITDDTEGIEYGPFGTPQEAYDIDVSMDMYKPAVVRRIDCDYRSDVEVDRDGNDKPSLDAHYDRLNARDRATYGMSPQQIERHDSM
jgi:hypothetical protein